jgi:hypothetical protein
MMLAAPAAAGAVVPSERADRMREVGNQLGLTDIGFVERSCEESASHDSSIES